MAINIHNLRVSNMTVGPLSGGGNGGGGGSLLTDNVIFHYDLNNSSSYPGSGTTIYDLSSNGYNVTPDFSEGGSITSSGGITFASQGTFGQVSSATAWQSKLTSTFSWSYTGWYQLPALGSDSAKQIVRIETNEFAVRYTTNGELAVQVATTPYRINDFSLSSSTYVPNSTTWFNLGVVLNGTSFKLFINGVARIDDTMVGNQFNSSPSYAHFSPMIQSPFAQGILYDRALTDAEVLSNYNALSSSF